MPPPAENIFPSLSFSFLFFSFFFSFFFLLEKEEETCVLPHGGEVGR